MFILNYVYIIRIPTSALRNRFATTANYLAVFTESRAKAARATEICTVYELLHTACVNYDSQV